MDLYCGLLPPWESVWTGEAALGGTPQKDPGWSPSLYPVPSKLPSSTLCLLSQGGRSLVPVMLFTDFPSSCEK